MLINVNQKPRKILIRGDCGKQRGRLKMKSLERMEWIKQLLRIKD